MQWEPLILIRELNGLVEAKYKVKSNGVTI